MTHTRTAHRVAIITKARSITARIDGREYIWTRWQDAYFLFQKPTETRDTDLDDINSILAVHKMPTITAQALEFDTDKPSFEVW
jgi:hypothetical protein